MLSINNSRIFQPWQTYFLDSAYKMIFLPHLSCAGPHFQGCICLTSMVSASVQCEGDR